MKTQSGLLRSLVTTSALALMMGFAGTASAAILDTCTVNTTDPDAFATVTEGTALFAGCGLGDGANENTSTFLVGWDFYGKKDATGDAGSTTGWTVTGFTGATTGTWQIDADAFDADTKFLLLLKDGSGANPDGVLPATNWVWFEISSFAGLSGGDWTMWGNGKDGEDSSLKESSHMSLYVRDGGGDDCLPDDPDCGENEIPEPGVLFLMGAGLLGLGMARRRKSA